MLVYLHILTGAVALIAGTIAFSSRKGALLHKRAGLVFVVTMLLMSGSGVLLAVLNAEKLNIVAGCVTFYLVATAFIVVHPIKRYERFYSSLLMVFGFAIGTFGILNGVVLLGEGITLIDGNPTQVIIIFGTISLIASISDLRITFFGKLKGKAKLIRHVWRIGTAMFIATASFFLGQSQVIPEVIRIMTVLVAPVLMVLLLTIYWTVRIQFWGLKRRI